VPERNTPLRSGAYLRRDHLGSSSVIVDGSGNAVNREFYYPFGGNRGSAFSELTSKRFTGQYHEDGLPGGEGLSYYNARWYDAQLGRFVSADTIVPNPANPQAFNRYTYVLNSPLGHIDPSGHEPCPSGNWGDCLPPSKSNDPVRNSTRLYNQQSSYSSKGTRWEDVPGETRAYWRTWGINKGRYQDCCGNAKLQKGLKDPATVISGVVGVWRLGGQALRLAPQAFRWLTGGATAACADGDCGNESSAFIRTYRIVKLRLNYEYEVRAIGTEARRRLSSGQSVEDVARWTHATRRSLGVKYKAITPPEQLEIIYQRNLEKYGDRLGPTVDFLRNQRGLSWEEIIESASRPGGRDMIGTIFESIWRSN
jgi:RHS repeat-associated protein